MATSLSRPKRLLFLILGLVICLTLSSRHTYADLVLYSNDFDGNVQNGGAVTTSISGGNQNNAGDVGGIQQGQGYAAIANFGGNFWRVTTKDDVLEFLFSNTPTVGLGSLEFSLATIDSWDGNGSTNGPDEIRIEILDGANQIVLWQEVYDGSTTPSSNVESVLVQNQQLGFNSGTDVWWREEGYRMVFDNLPMTEGSMTFRISGTGIGFQGGLDESFAIDNLALTSNVPEPTLAMFLLGGLGFLIVRRNKQLG